MGSKHLPWLQSQRLAGCEQVKNWFLASSRNHSNPKDRQTLSGVC